MQNILTERVDDSGLVAARAETILRHLMLGEQDAPHTGVISLIGQDEARKVEEITAATHRDMIARQQRVAAVQTAQRRFVRLSGTWIGRLLRLGPSQDRLDEYIKHVERALIHNKQSVEVRSHDLAVALENLEIALDVTTLVAQRAPTSKAQELAQNRVSDLEAIRLVAQQAQASLEAGSVKNEATEKAVRAARQKRDAIEALTELRAALQTD